MRKREARSDRIVRLLASMDSAGTTELQDYIRLAYPRLAGNGSGPLPIRHSQTRNRRVLLWVQSVVLAECKLLFAVEYARLDQNDGLDRQTTEEATLTPCREFDSSASELHVCIEDTIVEKEKGVH